MLQKYGFLATVFVVAEFVGTKAEWDAAYGEPSPLLTWDEMRILATEGVTFGVHSASHPYFTRLATRNVIEEGRRSRARLEAELGREGTIMSYPFGHNDIRVRLANGCLRLSLRGHHRTWPQPARRQSDGAAEARGVR